MIGPEGYLHRWTVPRQITQRTRKIDGTSKGLVEPLVDFKVYAPSVLGFLGSTRAPEGATLEEEAHALQCTTDAVPADLPRAGSVCSLGVGLFGIRTISLLRSLERPPIRAHSSTSLRKFVQLVNTTGPPHTPSLPNGKKSSWLYSAMEAYEYLCHMDHAGRIADPPCDKKQGAATALLRDTLQNRDITVPIAARASRILGPSKTSHGTNHTEDSQCCTRLSPWISCWDPSRFFVMARARQSDSTLTMKRKNCRVGCPGEPDALTRHNWCPLLLQRHHCLEEMLQSALEEIICFTTSYVRPF